MFVVAQSFFSVVFFAVEFLINYRKPGDFMNMVSLYTTPKFSFIYDFKINKASNFDRGVFFLEFQRPTWNCHPVVLL